jgi:foldase protein PrsA
VKRILPFVISLAVVALAACGAEPSATPAAPTPTLPTPTSPPPTLTPIPAATPATSETIEPGGVEVALTLVTIPDQELVAVVDGEEVSTATYEEELSRALYSVTSSYMVDWNDPANEAFLPALQEQVLEQIIQRILLRQVASEEGVTVDPEDVEAEIDALRTEVEESGEFVDWASFLAESGLTDESIRPLMSDSLLVEALIERHGGPNTAEHVHASHILVETEEIGQEVLDKLDEGEDFAELAAEYSTDPGSKDQGGDLGWFPAGMMVPEFEETAFSLEAGEISGLVQTDYGYHIIQVHEKEERELDPTIYAELQQQRFQTWFEDQQVGKNVERLYTFETSE